MIITTTTTIIVLFLSFSDPSDGLAAGPHPEAPPAALHSGARPLRDWGPGLRRAPAAPPAGASARPRRSARAQPPPRRARRSPSAAPPPCAAAPRIATCHRPRAGGPGPGPQSAEGPGRHHGACSKPWRVSGIAATGLVCGEASIRCRLQSDDKLPSAA